MEQQQQQQQRNNNKNNNYDDDTTHDFSFQAKSLDSMLQTTTTMMQQSIRHNITVATTPAVIPAAI